MQRHRCLANCGGGENRLSLLRSVERKGALCIWIEQEGMRVGGCCSRGRRIAGILLVIAGVLIVFVCLPREFFLIVLGVALAAAGLLLLQ